MATNKNGTKKLVGQQEMILYKIDDLIRNALKIFIVNDLFKDVFPCDVFNCDLGYLLQGMETRGFLVKNVKKVKNDIFSMQFIWFSRKMNEQTVPANVQLDSKRSRFEGAPPQFVEQLMNNVMIKLLMKDLSKEDLSLRASYLKDVEYPIIQEIPDRMFVFTNLKMNLKQEFYKKNMQLIVDLTDISTYIFQVFLNFISMNHKPLFCPNCGMEVDKDYIFCVNCGYKLV